MRLVSAELLKMRRRTMSIVLPVVLIIAMALVFLVIASFLSVILRGAGGGEGPSLGEVGSLQFNVIYSIAGDFVFGAGQPLRDHLRRRDRRRRLLVGRAAQRVQSRREPDQVRTGQGRRAGHWRRHRRVRVPRHRRSDGVDRCHHSGRRVCSGESRCRNRFREGVWTWHAGPVRTGRHRLRRDGAAAQSDRGHRRRRDPVHRASHSSPESPPRLARSAR